MAGRYLVTGTQLGMIKGLCEAPDQVNAVVDEILEDQFIGNSQREVLKDVEILKDTLDQC